jgi:hypothetical protein
MEEGFNRQMRSMLASIPGYDLALDAFDVSMNQEGHLHKDFVHHGPIVSFEVWDMAAQILWAHMGNAVNGTSRTLP